MNTQDVTVELTRAEALVLFEFLARYMKEERLEIEDQAEQRVLWDICASLEKILAEPFAPDYVDLVAKARAQVRDAAE
jgi:hypothetical protein